MGIPVWRGSMEEVAFEIGFERGMKFPLRDEKGGSTKQRFSSCSWYLYRINRQGVLVPHVDIGTPAGGPLSVAAWAGEERRLWRLPACDSHHSARISLVRTSHMVLLNHERTGKYREEMERWRWNSLYYCAASLEVGKTCIVIQI